MIDTKVKIVIEIPRGSNVKYELNKDTQVLEVDRILKVKYPFNYGFIPDTLWEDGDALDAIVVGNFSLHPGVVVYANPIALIKMYDGGKSDFKLVCSLGDKFNDHKKSILRFLETYKKGIIIDGYTTETSDFNEVLDLAANAYWRGI